MVTIERMAGELAPLAIAGEWPASAAMSRGMLAVKACAVGGVAWPRAVARDSAR
jgi:hypothetical protein